MVKAWRMKISVIGTGKVGVTVAFHLVLRGLATELILHSRNLRRADGDARDLDHAQAMLPRQAEIAAGGVEETAGSRILIVCASCEMNSPASRLSLGPKNVRMLEELLPPLLAVSPEAILVMVSNPVDVLTWHALRITGLPPSRVIGTGTLLDSIRFRRALSRKTGIHPDDLRAYILGEHGDSQFPAMSTAMAGAEPIEDTPEVRSLFRDVIGAGGDIFAKKGFTNFGVAAATNAIVESIARDEKRTMPLSVRIDGFCGVREVCLSVPVVLGKEGVERVLKPSLNEAECAAFRRSAEVVRAAIAEAS
jgi:L-lactate dehydrogenase